MELKTCRCENRGNLYVCSGIKFYIAVFYGSQPPLSKREIYIKFSLFKCQKLTAVMAFSEPRRDILSKNTLVYNICLK